MRRKDNRSQQKKDKRSASKKLPEENGKTLEISPEKELEAEEWPPLDENALSLKFDQAFKENDLPEEGIQSVRDIFLELCVYEKRVEKSIEILKEQQQVLEKENSVYKRYLDEETSGLSKLKSQKDRLQSLCDELSRNKEALIQQSKQNVLNDQALRQSMNEKFASTIKDISTRLEESSAQRIKSAEENEKLKLELRSAINEYQSVENDYISKIAAVDEKVKAALARFSLQEEKFLKEKQISDGIVESIHKMNDSEIKMKSELASYVHRFEEFQESMTKSNEMFMSSKVTIDELTAQSAVLEAENAELSNQTSQSNAELERAISVRESADLEFEKTQKQIEKLKGLVSVLQKEIHDKSQATAALDQQMADDGNN